MKDDLNPPPIYFSIITGFIVLPILIIMINKSGKTNIIFQVLISIGILVSVLISVQNRKYIAYLRSKGVPFLLRGASWSKDNIENTFIPAWIRIIVIFACTICSLLILSLLKIRS